VLSIDKRGIFYWIFYLSGKLASFVRLARSVTSAESTPLALFSLRP
jgi:hypothetical protein